MFLQSQKRGVFLKISVKNKIEIELVKTAFLDPSLSQSHTIAHKTTTTSKSKALKIY